jgi:hypothetical protein
MRNFTVGLVSGLVALVGFAGSASAGATIDLLWAATSTNTITGVSASSNMVLNVVLTAGANGSTGGGVSVDYSALVGDFTVVSAVNLPAAPLTGSFGAPVITASQVQNIQAWAFPGPTPAGIAPGASFLMGTITFHSITGAPGSFQIDSFFFGTDGIGDGFFVDITGATTLNSAFVLVPEPNGTLMVAVGAGVLALLYRRRRYSFER